MGYSTVADVTKIIAQSLTSSKPNVTGKVNLNQIGNTRDSNITTDQVNQYIRWADDEIDSDLSVLYRTPLIEAANGEWTLEQDIDEYNPDRLILSSAVNLVPGDVIWIITTATNPPTRERHIVATVEDINTITTEDPVFTNFMAGLTRVVRVGFPPAIVLISSRKSAANIFDKYFSAQASPDISDYGNNLRKLAHGQLGDILNGVVVLHGQERLANRFASNNLYDRYQLLHRDGNDNRDLKGSVQA